jgi:hypothetical protein
LAILGNYIVIWYIFPRFGKLYQEKSGNPGAEQCNVGFQFCEQQWTRMRIFLCAKKRCRTKKARHTHFSTHPFLDTPISWGCLERDGIRLDPDQLGSRDQGCQMVFKFQTKNPNLGKFGGALAWKMMVHFMAIWNILRLFYDHLVMLRQLGISFTVLEYCAKKNLATLHVTTRAHAPFNASEQLPPRLWSQSCDRCIINSSNAAVVVS